MKMRKKQIGSDEMIVDHIKPTRRPVVALSCALMVVALLVYLTLTGEGAVGTVLGQGPEEPASEPPLDRDPAAPEIVLDQPPYTMNYQGYLTDSSGNPLNGTYDMTFRLYNAASGGSSMWGPETHSGVQVTNGIFQVTLGSSVTLTPDVFDEALFLAVRVAGTWVSPRQPLRTVPYAFGLVPGARVVGDPDGTGYGLYVSNSGTDSADRGIYAHGRGLGVFASGVTEPGLTAKSSGYQYAIRSQDAIVSNEGYAGPDTYVWVPVHNAVIDYGDVGADVHLEPHAYGELRVVAGPGVSSSTAVHVHIPIQVERPYGRDYLLRSVWVFYRVESSAKLDTAYIRGRDFSTGATRLIAANGTDGTSTSFTYYDIQASAHYTITTSQAPTNVDLLIDTPNSSSTFYLYGVRLQLDSTYE